MDAIKQQVRSFVQDNFMLGSDPAQLRDGDSFMEHHIIDSTGFLELISFLEETFGITIADEEMVPENLDGVDRAVQFVARKRAA